MSIRRYFQFRLSTLLAGMAVLCVALVIIQHLRYARQLDAMLKRCEIEFVALGVDGATTPISALQAKYAAAVGHEFHLRRYQPLWQACFFSLSDPVTDEDLLLLPTGSS